MLDAFIKQTQEIGRSLFGDNGDRDGAALPVSYLTVMTAGDGNMNIDIAAKVEQTYAYSRSHNSPTVRQEQEIKSSSFSRWETKDTVTLSGQVKEYSASDPAFQVPRPKPKASYTAEELAPIKDAFANLQAAQRDMQTDLRSFMSTHNINLGPGDNLRLEVASNGEILVGGIHDAKTARKMAKAINDDGELATKLRDFQKKLKETSSRLKDITGMSLNDHVKRIDEWQKNPEAPFMQNEVLSLKDQALYYVDEEFAVMIAEQFASPPPITDLFVTENILENASGTVDKTVRKIMDEVEKKFAEMNEHIREQYGDLLPPEELEKMLVSLDKLKIDVDSDGMVVIEGEASEDSEWDRKAKERIRTIYGETLKNNPVTGKEHDYFIASQYLLNQYDNAFDGDDKTRKLEVTFARGKIESHISSPKEEGRLRADIAENAIIALRDMDVDADGLEVEVNDAGKLFIPNLSPEEQKRRGLPQALEMLNKLLKDREIIPVENFEAPEGGPMENLKRLMSKLDVFLPGGARKLDSIKKAS